jgi:hypothetical protein
LSLPIETGEAPWWERRLKSDESAALPWWERVRAFNPYHVQHGEHGGEFTRKEDHGESGPPTRKKVTQRQVKADESWARAQEKKPVVGEHPSIIQREMFAPVEDIPTEEHIKQIGEAQAAIGWSDEKTLDEWVAYDEEVEKGLQELGLGVDDRHPNESLDEHDARVLRAQWRDRVEKRPSAEAQAEMGPTHEWKSHESKYGNPEFDQEKLDAWKEYDQSFKSVAREEGESRTDYYDRLRRDEQRIQNIKSGRLDKEAADAEAEKARIATALESPKVVAAVESVSTTRELLDYGPADDDARIEAKEAVMGLVGGTIAADSSVSVEQLRAFNGDDAFVTGTESVNENADSERDMESELAADKIVAKWANTSGDHDKGAVAVQLVAQKTFGLSDAATDHLGVKFDGQALADQHEAVISSGLKGMYSETQDRLQDAPEMIWLFRGVSYDVPDGTKVQLQPLSSFSTNPKTAMEFAGGRTGDGSVFAVQVPKSRIFSTARTGNGCLSEEEVVVLGGWYEAHAVSIDAAAEPDQFGNQVVIGLQARGQTEEGQTEEG